MKSVFVLLFSFLFFVFYYGCSANQSSRSSSSNSRNRRVLSDSTNQTSRRSSSRCSSENLQDESLSLRRPDHISSRNAGDYHLSGRCSTAESFVEINILGASQEVACYGGRWETDVDVTSIVQDEEDVTISVQSGSYEVCGSVRNSFLCPDGYIAVARLTEDDDIDLNYDFCVMQYEASRESGRNSFRSSRSSRSSRGSYNTERQREEFQEEYSERALSRSNQDSWTDLSLSEVRRRCSNNGIGYELISNEEWQVIARNIELEPSNWFLERTTIESGNYLNTGVPGYGSASSRRSSSSRQQGVRSHTLINGEEIFDFGGGVWEMVSDSTSIIGEKTSVDNVFELSGNLKKLFGPKRNYSNAVASSRGSYTEVRGLGLGGVFLSRIDDIIVRGGSDDRDVGVFAVKADISDSRLRDIGFRCVYRP